MRWPIRSASLNPFKRLVPGVVFVVGLGLLLWAHPVQAASGINEQVNFQARLLNSAGATVADGTYNMRFKIYQDGDGVLGGGDETLKWTETRQNSASAGVTVTNGYFSVQLGSVTAFASNVDWNQDTLWLSIDIAGTGTGGSPTYDGEMTPFKRLSANPYALNSGRLGGIASSGFVQLSPSGAQTGTINVTSSITAGGALQGATGVLTGASSLTLGTASTNLGAILFKNAANANVLTLRSGSTASSINITLPTAVGSSGDCLKDSDGAGTLAFSACVSGYANTALSNLASVAINTTLLPGTAGAIDLGSATKPFADLYLAGTSGTPGTNNFQITGASTSGTRVVTLPDATGTVCLASTTACGFILNQTGAQSSSNFNISGTGIAATALQAPLIDTADSSSADTAALVVRSGDETGSSKTSGALTLRSGNASGGTNSSSGAVNIDSGSKSGSGTTGAITIGTTNSTSTTIGNTSSTVALQASTLSFNSATWQRIASGTTTLDVKDTADTTFTIDNSGLGNANLTVSGTYNSNTFNNSTLTFGASATTISTAAGSAANTGALTINSGDESGSSKTSGAVTLKSGDAGGGTNSSSGNVTIDVGSKSGSGTSGTLNIGTTNASGDINIGNTSANITLESRASLGGINIATSDAAHTILIGTGGTGTNTAVVTIGSTSTNSLTTFKSGNGGGVVIQGGDSDTSAIVFKTNNGTKYFKVDSTNARIYTGVTYPLYVPAALPAGFSLDQNSVSGSPKAVIFSISYGSGQKLAITEQPKPAEYDFDQLKGDRQFNTRYGHALIKVKDDTTNASLVTDRTWLLINAPQRVSTDDVEFIIKHLELLKR